MHLISFKSVDSEQLLVQSNCSALLDEYPTETHRLSGDFKVSAQISVSVHNFLG